MRIKTLKLIILIFNIFIFSLLFFDIFKLLGISEWQRRIIYIMLFIIIIYNLIISINKIIQLIIYKRGLTASFLLSYEKSVILFCNCLLLYIIDFFR